MKMLFAGAWATAAAVAVIMPAGCTSLLSADGDYHLAGTGGAGGKAAHASSSRASSSGTGGATPTGVVGIPGEPCPMVGELGCAGNGQKSQVICGPNKQWEPNGTCDGDGADLICNTEAGPDQGTCAPVVMACAGANPGDIICLDGTHRGKCGPDLVTTTDVAECMSQACVNGDCVGVCAPGQGQCTDAGEAQGCDPTGKWGVPMSCGDCFCNVGLCNVCP